MTIITRGSKGVSFNKKRFEITVTENLKDLGIKEVSIFNENIIVRFSEDIRNLVVSKFRIEDLNNTMETLEKKLLSNNIDKDVAKRLITLLVQEILRKSKELGSKEEEELKSTTDIKKILEEIEKDKSTIGQISREEWLVGLDQRFHKLCNVVNCNLPNLWPSLEFELSIMRVLNIQKITLPFAGIVLGSPSSLKTLGIELFRKWPRTYYTDNFTAKSFVSHSTAVTREELSQIDMLPKIRNKLFLTPELAPTFAAKDDDLIQILGIMTRILDGHGYESDTGAHGHRGYSENMMFAWIGAAVDITYKVHRYLGTLGPKLYFLRLPKGNKTEGDYYKQLNDNFEQNKKEIEEALYDYLKWFEIGPDMIVEKSSGLPKIEWNSAKDDEIAKRYVIKLARLLAHLRGVVATFHTEGTQGSNYGYGMATMEEPDRAITQLYNLARGHALLKGRNYITIEDIPLVVKVVLSTASIERVTIFDLLLAHKGKMTTSQIANSLNISHHTAHRTMTELKALGLVDMEKESETTNSEYQISLDPKFDWFLTKEFLQLREGFVPSDNSEYLNKSKENMTTAVEKQHEEKIPLISQENDDSDSTIAKDNGGIMERKREENLPLTDANLIPFNQQQLEEKNTLTTSNCDFDKHEEKRTNITQKNNNSNNNRQQVGKEKSEIIRAEEIFINRY
jgi:HTH domain